jgi:hypothetical protein
MERSCSRSALTSRRPRFGDPWSGSRTVRDIDDPSSRHVPAHRRRPPRGLANRRAAVLSPDAARFGVKKHAPPPRARGATRALREHRGRGRARYTEDEAPCTNAGLEWSPGRDAGFKRAPPRRRQRPHIRIVPGVSWRHAYVARRQSRSCRDHPVGSARKPCSDENRVRTTTDGRQFARRARASATGRQRPCRSPP